MTVLLLKRVEEEEEVRGYRLGAVLRGEPHASAPREGGGRPPQLASRRMMQELNARSGAVQGGDRAHRGFWAAGIALAIAYSLGASSAAVSS